MSHTRTLTLLCVLLLPTLLSAHLSPEVIQERLPQKLKDHDAESVLRELPLLSALCEEPARDPLTLHRLLCSTLRKRLQMNISSAHILQLQTLPSADSQELTVKVPLDIEVELKMLLVKDMIKLQVSMEAQASIREEVTDSGEKRLVLGACSSSEENLHLNPKDNVLFLVRPAVNKVMSLLTPVLPKLVKRQLCPVIEAAVQDLRGDIQQSETFFPPIDKPESPVEPKKLEVAS
ncbi:BPI fold-containing family B member 1-like [Sorex araneus]|uniref:BPI fold-containing family B member 1-like n=1 Tax=Sorex araneus TaxID=42254 RepID=UPI002433D384|nr:BPI fold-containing family B member 1-like [Sorex araneus]